MTQRRGLGFASALLVIAGLFGMSAPPLAATPVAAARHHVKSRMSAADDPIIGWVQQWFSVDETCYGGPAYPANPDMISPIVIHGTVNGDGSFTDTSEDLGGYFTYNCEGYHDYDLYPAWSACLSSDSGCPLLEEEVRYP
jgi:hypothetical protein